MRASLFTVLALAGCAGDLPTSPGDAVPRAMAGQLPLPQTMDLSMGPSPLVAGRWIDVEVFDATPGATVGIAVSDGVPGAGSCPGWLGDCLDITSGTSGYQFIILGTADALGRVQTSTTLPRSQAPGAWSFQALSDSGPGGSFVASAPLALDVLPFRANCPGDDAFENDDAAAAGTVIQVGHASTGRVLCRQDDIDWHRIALHAGDAVTFQADFTHAEGDIDLYVMGAPSPNNLATLNTTYLERGYGSSDQELVPFVAPADGVYYVGVRLYADRGTTPGNTYDFQVNPTPHTCTLGFDDAFASFGDGGDPTDAYGAYGVQFTMERGWGLIGGVANGDPGNWSSDPAAIPDAAWGCWDLFGGDENTVSFDSPVTGFSATAYAGNQGSPQTLRVEGFLQGSSLGVASYVLDYAGPISQEVTVPGPVDRVVFSLSSGSIAYAIDDIRYDTAATCP
ncbi:MAG: PPC domain-containing protein [Alphaproteobacteria bacterium]|nr:PPC domain-containing protein [Alphaproteobacteria bacterium]